jgi:serine/threonine-protein kinase HipA
MCDEDFIWRATPAYDITFAKGKKQTIEHQLLLYGKKLSQIGLEDVVRLADEFSIDLKYVSNIIENIKNIRDNELPKLLDEYKIKKQKKQQVLNEVNSRTFQGAI